MENTITDKTKHAKRAGLIAEIATARVVALHADIAASIAKGNAESAKATATEFYSSTTIVLAEHKIFQAAFDTTSAIAARKAADAAENYVIAMSRVKDLEICQD